MKSSNRVPRKIHRRYAGENSAPPRTARRSGRRNPDRFSRTPAQAARSVAIRRTKPAAAPSALQRCWLSPDAAARPFSISRISTAWRPQKDCAAWKCKCRSSSARRWRPDTILSSDLVGCEVWEAGASSALGSVRRRGVYRRRGAPAGDRPEGQRSSVPLAAEFCVRIDVAIETHRRKPPRRPAGLESQGFVAPSSPRLFPRA